MSPSAKILLTGVGIAGAFGLLALLSSRKASAKPGAPPDVIVPDEPPRLPGANDFLALGIFTPAEAAAAANELATLAAQNPQLGQHVLGLLTGQSNTPTDYSGTAIQLQQSGRPNLARAVIAVAGQKFGGVAPSAAVPAAPTPSVPVPPVMTPAPPPPPAAAPTVPVAVPAPPPSLPAVPAAPSSPAPAPSLPAPPLPELPTTIGPVTIPTPLGPITTPPIELPSELPSLPSLPPTAQPAEPAPAPAAPAVPTATTVSADTAALVASLLAAETKAGWNKVSDELKAWQKPRGLVVDGKFGPKSALTIAAELGTIPLIRFWPKGSQKEQALSEYRTALYALANTAEPARAAQLRFSAEREQAQSWGIAAGKAPAIPPALQVSLAKVA